jgi:hypothetical protein
LGARDKILSDQSNSSADLIIPMCFLGGPVEVGEIASSRKRIYVAATPLGFIIASN